MENDILQLLANTSLETFAARVFLEILNKGKSLLSFRIM